MDRPLDRNAPETAESRGRRCQSVVARISLPAPAPQQYAGSAGRFHEMSSDYRRDFWSAAGDSRSFLDKALFAQDPRLPGVDAQRLLSLDLADALDVNVADLDRVRAGHRENLVD